MSKVPVVKKARIIAGFIVVFLFMSIMFSFMSITGKAVLQLEQTQTRSIGIVFLIIAIVCIYLFDRAKKQTLESQLKRNIKDIKEGK